MSNRVIKFSFDPNYHFIVNESMIIVKEIFHRSLYALLKSQL